MNRPGLAHGRSAWSEYRVLRRFANFTLLEVRIGTGRTHQIRAHMASIGIRLPAIDSTALRPRRPPQAASSCTPLPSSFDQPSTGEPVEISPPCRGNWKPGCRAIMRHESIAGCIFRARGVGAAFAQQPAEQKPAPVDQPTPASQSTLLG